MRLHWPWAKREHCHVSRQIYEVCAGCGHLVLQGQKRNKIVEEIRHLAALQEGIYTVSRRLSYGEGCAPPYDKVIIGDEVEGGEERRYYSKGARVELRSEKP